ncbi:MAG: hypothetical protein U0172_04230 [Nitrospiraceae bacterium]
MYFDPALEAQHALERSHITGEFGDEWDRVEELETQFSSSAGPDASAAYRELVALGDSYPKARHFLEFLVYISWQQVTEQTIPAYFRQGARLADRWLAQRRETDDPASTQRVELLKSSFYEGLGEKDSHELEDEFRRDRVKGGD